MNPGQLTVFPGAIERGYRQVNLDALESPASIAVAEQVRQLEIAGRRVLRLQTGDPVGSTHKAIAQAMTNAVNEGATHYGPSRGLPALRNALMERMPVAACEDATVPASVLVTAGAIHALFLTLSVLIRPGAKVLLLEPYYPQYRILVRLLGGIPVEIPAIADPYDARTMSPDLDVLEVSATSCAGIILNSPNNPSGHVFSSAERGRLLSIARDNDLWVVSDEVYANLVADRVEARSLFEHACDSQDIYVVDSFSKWWSMTGWRLGWVVGPEHVVETIGMLLETSLTCVPPFIQAAGVAALTDPDVERDAVSDLGRLNRMRETLSMMLNDLGVPFIYPKGAFYYLVRPPRRRVVQSARLAASLLEDIGVATVPGVAYGRSTDSYLRLSFSGSESEVIEGFEQVARYLRSL